jgi:hypothetical protein
MPVPAALDFLCTRFGLTPFEREVLITCAAVELEAAFGALCGAAQGDPAHGYPSFSLALAAFPGAHWSALAPSAPLRGWHLIELSPGPALTQCPLRIDERILNYLTGVSHLDERLRGIVTVVESAESLFASHQEVAGRLVAAWSRAGYPPVVQLCGPDAGAKREIALAASSSMGWHLGVIYAHSLPTAASDLQLVARLLEREAALSALAIYVDCDGPDLGEPGTERPLGVLAERMSSPLVVGLPERRSLTRRRSIRLDVQRPHVGEQAAAWKRACEVGGWGPDGEPDRLASQFNLSASAITAAGEEALSRAREEVEKALPAILWDCCRAQARPHLENLAQRVEAVATWDDLILPEPQREVLELIARQLRHRRLVHYDWGFAAKSTRGLGLSALFVGPSGTGKTMAAEVLAREVQLDLYRIDLSEVVSKYIGETEKNLRRVFDAAEEGGAILLFDEADALFGKRSEVHDSHDRYANIEISYLLQRMEAYRGLAILTTNLKSEIDSAFLRRIKFVVQFPFPDAAQRAEIWRRIFPAATPTAELDPDQLGLLNVAGGNIRNIALNAAFLAADAGRPVGMEQILAAARTEYMKLERTLTPAEVGGWV